MNETFSTIVVLVLPKVSKCSVAEPLPDRRNRNFVPWASVLWIRKYFFRIRIRGSVILVRIQVRIWVAIFLIRDPDPTWTFCNH
jgi:hypothetical protein